MYGISFDLPQDLLKLCVAALRDRLETLVSLLLLLSRDSTYFKTPTLAMSQQIISQELLGVTCLLLGMLHCLNVCSHSKRLLGNVFVIVTGHVEHFSDKCGGVPSWLDRNTYYTAFTEGWGLYSENPVLSDDTDTYKDNLLQKYGMVKWQVSDSHSGF